MMRLIALVPGLLAALLACTSGPRVVAAGFWFEDVTLDQSEAGADRLGGAITKQELKQIESIARFELGTAYQGLRIAFSERRDAFYRVAVVQNLRHPVLSGMTAAGQSYTVGGFGGSGAVSFRTLASNAIAHAPPRAQRAEMIEAIGKGIGRAAVHELAHQILRVNVDSRTDARSYEYDSADRAEQYYGRLHWADAWPLLLERLGP